MRRDKRSASPQNGFYAFESALHVFPDRSTGSELGLDQWNSPQLWRAKYEDMAEGLFFFAEDIFGFQFCIRGGDVCTFNPETGDVEPLARDLHEWAEKILSDYNFLTGYPIGHKWQLIHGPIAPRTRLTPKIPFVLGGKFETENLYARDVVEAMRFRGHLAIQIRDLPDGSQIEFQITD